MIEPNDMQQVARAGRFGTKGLAITFVSEDSDAAVLNDVQSRFEVSITELPATIDKNSYSTFYAHLFLRTLTLSSPTVETTEAH